MSRSSSTTYAINKLSYRLRAVAKGDDVENVGSYFFLQMIYMIYNMVVPYCDIIYVKNKNF